MQSKIALPDEQPVTVNALRNKRAKIAGQSRFTKPTSIGSAPI
jgi:hypothetical protein